MIFMLSSLSNNNYTLYRDIVTKYEMIKVKGIVAAKTDCKGSNFRGLRGLSEMEITEILRNCASGENTLKSLNSTSLNKKKMKKIVESFVSLIGTKDWNEAQKRYPNFANEKQLADLFLKCNFSPIPAAFSDYCSRAVRYVHVLQTMQMNRIIA
jgi:hypothetical protein